MSNNATRKMLSTHGSRKSLLQTLVELYRVPGSFRFLVSFALLGLIVLTVMELGPAVASIWSSKTSPASVATSPLMGDKKAAALTNASYGLTKSMLGVPRPDAYKLVPSVFATTPDEHKEKLFAAASAYSNKEPAIKVLNLLEDLDTTEPNAAFLRGLATLALGGRPNAEAGLSLLKHAADANHTGAMALWGLAQINPPSFIDKDPPKGRHWLQRAVDAGDGQAAYLLGHAYLSGWAGIIDPARSVSLFRIAANVGHVDAMKVLATLAMSGQGMPRDSVESETMLRRAAGLGDVEAQTALGMYLAAANAGGWEHSFEEAIYWLTKAAEQGLVEPMNMLGMIYLEYARGTPFHNVDKGLAWMQRCANLRHQKCYHALGHIYESGRGVSPDAVQAAVYYKFAKATEPYERMIAQLSESDKSRARVLYSELSKSAASITGIKTKPQEPPSSAESFSSTATKKELR